MKLALWLAISQLLHGVVDGFIVPQHICCPGTTWSKKSSFTPRVSPLFSEENESETKVPVPPPTLPELEEIQAVQQPKVQLSAEEQKNVGASGVGAAFLGLITGALLVFEFPDLDIVMEPLVWPLVTSVVFAVAGFFGGASNGKVGEIVRGSLGKTTRAISSAIIAVFKSLVTSVIALVKASIDAAIESAQNQVKKTTDDIKAIPSKVATAAREKVEDTVEDIQRIPSLVKEAAIETAEDVKQLSIKKAAEVVEEIKATPGRVVESSKRAAQDVVDDTLDAVEKVVEEVVSIPKKAVENMEEQVNKLVGPKKPDAPQPPDSAPPLTNVEPATPKIPPPSFEKSTVSTPKLELPKLDLPKVEMPKIEVPKIEVPTLNLPTIERRTPNTDPVKGTKPKKENPVDEIFEIQQAVFKATQQARKEKATEISNETGRSLSMAQENKEAKKAADTRKEVAKKAAEANRKREEELAQKKAAVAEAERQREEAIARKKTEASKQKQVAAIQKSLQSEPPRRTISLADLFGAVKIEAEDKAIPVQQAPLKVQAPPGVPTLRNWKQNVDGSITGIIADSTAFKEGESITTSPVPSAAVSGSVVKTNSGSKYFLGQQGGFSFGFLNPSTFSALKPATPQTTGTRSVAPNNDSAAASRRVAEERKVEQAAAAEERRRIAEAQKAAIERQSQQAALAEDRRKAAEAKAAAQAALVEERRRAAEDAKARQDALAKERRQATEEKKAQQAALAEERRKTSEMKAAQAAAVAAEKAEERRRTAEGTKAAQAAEAEQKRKASVSLKPAETAAGLKATKPPRGVPEIRAWKKTRDGGVSGKIYGSRSFNDGDFVETSLITKGVLENGSVVSTSSGSLYFLSSEPATKKANMAAARKDMSSAKPGATITLTKQRKEFEAAKATQAVTSARPRATFSLFGLGFGAADADLPEEPTASRPSRPIPKKEAPRGVPTMSRWKKNPDGSVTGLISGSKSFSDGERITTSPIKKGKLDRGEVVTTGSGSEYFLS